MGSLVANFKAGFGDDDVPPPPPPRSLYGEASETLGAQEQLLDRQYAYDRDATNMYAALYRQLYGDIAQSGVEEDLGLIDAYGGRTRGALQAYNPAAAGALDQVSALDAEQLASGMNLTPFEQRQLEQGYRSGLTSRGLSLGGGDAAREALNAYAGGNQLRQQRRQNSLQSAGAQQAFYGDPFQRLLGTGGATRGTQALGAAVGTAPRADLFNPYAADVYNTNFNAAYGERYNAQNRNQEQRANWVALDSAAMNAVASAASSF